VNSIVFFISQTLLNTSHCKDSSAHERNA